MTDSMMLSLIQSFLAAPPGTASPEERQAWEDFYHVHDPKIHAAIRARHEGWNIVDDLTQKVWCILIERVPDLRVDPARDSLKAWVTQVARRAACGHARDRLTSREQPWSVELAAELVDSSIGPGSRREELSELRDELGAVLCKLGATLPEVTGRILALRVLEGRSVPEIAAALGLSADSVKMRLRRGRRAIGNVRLRNN